MDLFLIDAIGPFFRGYQRKRINWSKIPFMHLADASPEDWAAIEAELREFARQVSAQGYNAVTLDDLAHLAHHPLHEPEVTDRIAMLRGKIYRILQPAAKRLRAADLSDHRRAANDSRPGRRPRRRSRSSWTPIIAISSAGVLDDFPQLSGLILRIGESDGNDVDRPHPHPAPPPQRGAKPTACCSACCRNSKTAGAI